MAGVAGGDHLLGISDFLGTDFKIGGHKAVYIFPDARLGIVFATVLVLIVTLTHLRPRGMVVFALLLIAIILGIVVEWTFSLATFVEFTSHLLVFMNAGFYAFVAICVSVVWAIGVFLVDRTSSWRFTPHFATERRQFGINNAYPTAGMNIELLPSSFLLHRLIGFGTGDLILNIPIGPNEMKRVRI